MVSRAELAVLSLGLALIFGCASQPPPRTTTPGVPVVSFPTKTELDALLVQPAAPEPPTLATTYVDRWQITTPAPAPGSPYPVDEFWDRQLVEHLATLAGGAARPLVASAELRCAARETARFFVDLAAFPGDELRNYLAARCGHTAPSFDIATYSFGVPDALGERELEAQLAPRAPQIFAPLGVTKGEEVGLGYARANGRGTIVFFMAKRRAKLAGYVPVTTGVGVTLRGKLMEQVDAIDGLVNHGRWGVKRCEPDRTVLLPEFSLFCPLSGEPAVRVQLVVRGPGRAMLEPVVSALIRATEDAGTSYEQSLLGPDAAAADTAAFSAAVLSGLAEARRAAGVPPLANEAAQAASSERVAPALFQAVAQGRSEVVDRIVLGLLAGWDVKEPLRSGGFYLGSSASERRPLRWLAGALEAPLGRHVLLDPDMSRVAMAAAPFPPAGIGAILNTYATFQGVDEASVRATVESELWRDRSAQGRSRPRFFPAGPALAAALARVEREGVSALAALTDLVNDLRRSSSAEVQGFAVETLDLHRVRWPSELLLLEGIEVELGITHYRPRGAAWSQYALLAIVRPASRSAAHRHPPGRRAARERIQMVLPPPVRPRPSASGRPTPCQIARSAGSGGGHAARRRNGSLVVCADERGA